MGTGGNNVPMLAFDTQFDSNANVTEDIAPTLKSSQQSPSVAYPIQDGREIEKRQNGFGVASDGEPSYTLDQTGAQAVAYSVREDAKANTFSATELDHANALSALRPSPQSHHAQMFIAEQVSFYDGYNQKLDDSGIHRSLRIGRDSSDFVAQPAEPTMAVRRLTPLECERLMGWPDDHTRYKADGTEQADTHRYRQCGNGVATPVAKWVAEQIAKVEYAEG
jgi:site-specific DNA-cytosine methylase